jgi:hypothetical protein
MNLGQNSQMEFDLFISHASEDNTVIARPLAQALRSRKYKVAERTRWGDNGACDAARQILNLVSGSAASAKVREAGSGRK